MDPAKEYRLRAEEAERLASETRDELERDAYRKIAEGWWDLAQAAILKQTATAKSRRYAI